MSDRDPWEELAWLRDLADLLIREIMEQSCGLRLYRQENPTALSGAIGGAYTTVSGAYRTPLAFCAQRELLWRMTCNMRELPMAEEADVEEYTKEFCNVLCGRLLAEVYHTNGIHARFAPPRYTTQRCPPNLQTGEPIYHFYYLSERGEAAEFSWTRTPLWLERRRQEDENETDDRG